MIPAEVVLVPGNEIQAPLRLLEGFLRDGEPVSDDFTGGLRGAVEAGSVEILAAFLDGGMAGVLVLAFRTSVSLGGLFASIEDLYVRPEARRRGAGTALMKAAKERCVRRRVSYLEAQVEEGGAATFYSVLGYEPEPDVRVFSTSLIIRDGRDGKAET